MSPIAIVNSTGFVDAEPASMNDEFISAPKKAAGPVRAPNRRPSPTRISPKTINQANHVNALFCRRTLRKSRYHSKVIGGRPWSGSATAAVQKPFSAAPPSSQPGPHTPLTGASLCQPASSQENPTKRRIGSQSQPAWVFEKRNRVNAGPSTWTSVAPEFFRSAKSRTIRPMKEIQKAQVTMTWTVSLILSGVNQGFSIQNSRTAEMTPRVTTVWRFLLISPEPPCEVPSAPCRCDLSCCEDDPRRGSFGGSNGPSDPGHPARPSGTPRPPRL